MLPGKQCGLPPGLSGAFLDSSAALGWIALFLFNLCFSLSGRASALLQTSPVLLMGLRRPLPGWVLRGSPLVAPSQGTWGILGGPEQA